MTVTSASTPAAAAVSVLSMLRRTARPVAPHVAMRLCTALADDQEAIAQVTSLLTPAQRAGLSALPDPLPPVPAVTAVFSHLDRLADAERRLLQAVSVSVDGRVDVVLAAAGLTMADALAGGAAPHVEVAAGRVAFADPRARIHVHAAATLAERTDVHAALAQAYRAAGDARLAVWHESLSTLEGDASLVAPLLDLADVARRCGAAEWAHSVAREAASHASGDERLFAHIAAGEAALDAGLVDDAVEWLRGPVVGPDDIAARALPAFVHAVTLSEGNVPDGDIGRHVARLRDTPPSASDSADHVSRALALAACLHAERGHDADAADLLALAGGLADRADSTERPSWAHAWCDLFRDTAPSPRPVHEPGDDDRDDGTAGSYGRIAHAIELAGSDRCEHALGALQGGAGATMGGASPWTVDLGQTRAAPLAEAHRRVAIALVEFWSGDLARARAELADASLVVPVGLPYSGLAVALARRLDVCTDGTSLATSLALEDTHPTPHARALRGGLLVDRAITAYLEGRMTEAATLLSLAADGASRGAAGLRLPGLDESTVWAATGRIEEARVAAERLEQSVAGMSSLQRRAVIARARVMVATPADVVAATRAAADACRLLASPYERARTEMVVGRARAAQGDLEAARAHLLAASGLFDAAGASVWRAACDADLDLLPAEAPVSVLTRPIPVSGPAAATPLARTPGAAPGDDLDDEVERACRDAWSEILTEREQDVALLVAQGHSNREVAARLFVSVRTVEVHLGRVFSKLAVPSRVALTVQAHRIARDRQPVAG
ncbi:helix-turn-helix transcriptional regulator [Microbacterium sulfonylureivorans]|uniref:helix-turn-helix transcriptional regulator n=1 Tax=Microbacterium sulfonylureivorans TaxID=2486854 RepID=UPI000FD805EF|nr:helix-turn-helix transcriptional regulator [Microbacterium sulfonylureivorans]